MAGKVNVFVSVYSFEFVFNFLYLYLYLFLFLYFFFLQSDAISFWVAGKVHVFVSVFSFEFFLSSSLSFSSFLFFVIRCYCILSGLQGTCICFCLFFWICLWLSFSLFLFSVIRCYCILSGRRGICCKEQISSQRGRAASLLQRTPAKNILSIFNICNILICIEETRATPNT